MPTMSAAASVRRAPRSAPPVAKIVRDDERILRAIGPRLIEVAHLHPSGSMLMLSPFVSETRPPLKRSFCPAGCEKLQE